MKFLHYELKLVTYNKVRIDLNKQANALLLDNSNFQNYRNGMKYRYYGGHATKTPVILSAPTSGEWHLVIDSGGYTGTIKASVSLI